VIRSRILVMLAAIFGTSCTAARTPVRPAPPPREAANLAPLLLEAPLVVALPPATDAGLVFPEVVRHAIRRGAPLDGRSALDVVEGNLVRVDLATGAMAILRSRFAVLSQCVAVRLATDTVLLCSTAGDYVPTLTAEQLTGPFVVSHVLEEKPLLEQGGRWFSSDARYWVSDDGGIVGRGLFCRPGPNATGSRGIGNGPIPLFACARAADGTWRLQEVDGGSYDVPRFQAVRWVPRGDGAAVLVVNAIDGRADAWGLVDGTTGELHRWTVAPDADVQRALGVVGGWGSCASEMSETCVDRTWSLTTTGGLLGWILTGDAMGRIEISADGTAHRSTQRFDRLLAAGPVALARAKDARVLQTLDHGATWNEISSFPREVCDAWPIPWGTRLEAVPSITSPQDPGPLCDVPGKGCVRPAVAAAPPPPPPPYTVCSPVGCELGGWLRVGWSMPWPNGARSP